MEKSPNNEPPESLDPSLEKFIDNYPGLDQATKAKLKREARFPGIRKVLDEIKKGFESPDPRDRAKAEILMEQLLSDIRDMP